MKEGRKGYEEEEDRWSREGRVRHGMRGLLAEELLMEAKHEGDKKGRYKRLQDLPDIGCLTKLWKVHGICLETAPKIWIDLAPSCNVCKDMH
jgi:hypothetical protein